MLDSDREQFFDMWSSVRVDVYDKPISAAGIDLVFNSLQRFDIDQVKRGITLHINDTQNGKFPIVPSHVVAQIEGQGDERAAGAWKKLTGAIGAIGSYDDVVFDDKIIHAIVDAEGGWVSVCQMSHDDLKFLQARFSKQYTAFVSRSGMFKHPNVLRGVINSDRIGKGLELDPPQTIGDVEQCRQVWREGSDMKLEINQPKSIEEFTNEVKAVTAQ